MCCILLDFLKGLVTELLLWMYVKDSLVRGVEVPGSGGRNLSIIGYKGDVTKVFRVYMV